MPCQLEAAGSVFLTILMEHGYLQWLLVMVFPKNYNV
jgi:hypothetical protein